jgi:hypothetical protein
MSFFFSALAPNAEAYVFRLFAGYNFVAKRRSESGLQPHENHFSQP